MLEKIECPPDGYVEFSSNRLGAPKKFQALIVAGARIFISSPRLRLIRQLVVQGQAPSLELDGIERNGEKAGEQLHYELRVAADAEDAGHQGSGLIVCLH
jgi:hypothetical protein